MTQQYKRACSLVVGSASGSGLELANLHVKFKVHQADIQTPGYAEIRVYNLSDATAKTIQQEFTHVFLQAGYEGNLGLVFSGAVRQYRRGRESATDTFLDILAQDGDEAYNWSVVNGNLAAGWSQPDLHGLLLTSMEPHGITEGYTPIFGGPAMPRGKACYGMARDYLRGLAEGSGTSWHLNNGQLNMVPTASALPGAATVLTSASGMIGLPQQNINGVTVQCLINPSIKFGGLVKLDNASIQQQSFNVSYQPGSSNQGFAQDGTGTGIVSNLSLDTDGIYKVYSLDIEGDTRGQPWYNSLVCVGQNATSPLQGPYINAVASQGTGG